jgi:trigger factor
MLRERRCRMQVDVQQLEPCKVSLTIQVPPEQITRTADQVFNRFAKRTTVPGFRKGKAPRKLAERFIDVAAVREAAMDQVIQDAYREALKQAEIEPYDQASVELKEFEEGQPLTFTATVPTKPEVNLGDYKGLQARRVLVPITDEDVSRELQRVREQSARYENVEEPATDGDRIQAHIEVTIDGEPVPDSSHESAWLLVGTNFPEFDEQVRGVAPGEEREFDFTFPDDLEDKERAGQKAHAKLKVERVQRRIVPEEDDAFAKSIGFESPEALRSDFRRQLEEAAQRQADEFVERDLVAEAVKRSTVHFPQSMVDEEVAHRMDTLLKGLERRGIAMDDYLAHQKKSLADLEADFAEEARQVITNTLVLSRIAHDNDISASQAEVQEELERRAQETGADPKVMRQVLQDQGELNRLINQVFMRKVMDYLKSVSAVKEA